MFRSLQLLCITTLHSIPTCYLENIGAVFTTTKKHINTGATIIQVFPSKNNGHAHVLSGCTNQALKNNTFILNLKHF